MGITRILLKSCVAKDKNYDVLIPLPANADACLKGIGIEEFDDADDDWDADFNSILKTLVGNEPYSIIAADPLTGEMETIDSAMINQIQSFLAYDDHRNLIIKIGERSITFTKGHEIFWLDGFSERMIMSLPFHIEKSENQRIGELF